MSRIPAPTLSHRLFFASRSRVFLCLLTAALIWLFSTQLLTLRGSYVPAQLISTPPADVEHSQQPTLPTSSQNAPLQTPELTHESARLPCESLQGLEDVFLIVRTGASEALEKLPVHFNTTLRCLPQNSYGIWSDLEETIDCHYVGNALDELSSSTINEHPDFGYYRRLQENGRAGFSVEEMTRWASAPNSASWRNTLGWKLDKWKFLPLAKKAYRQRPDAKWFIFTECDGYINWTSLLSWLSHHDPSTPYVGQLMVIGDVVFAYGGASFVVSNNAMKAVTEHYTADAEKYEDFTGHHWAGDCVLGKALKDIEIDFTQAWPTFLGDSPFDVNYNSSVSGPDRHLWCYYAMTWHHLSPFGMREFSAFEEDWNSKHSTLLRHADVFRYYIMPKLSSQVESWDNLSSDEESSDTLGDCHSICQSRLTCAQFSFQYHTQTCKTSTVIRLGRGQHSATQEERITSGWIMDRVEAFVTEMEASCQGDGWLVS